METRTPAAALQTVDLPSRSKPVRGNYWLLGLTSRPCFPSLTVSQPLFLPLYHVPVPVINRLFPVSHAGGLQLAAPEFPDSVLRRSQQSHKEFPCRTIAAVQA
jgi:hypothetical protein